MQNNFIFLNNVWDYNFDSTYNEFQAFTLTLSEGIREFLLVTNDNFRSLALIFSSSCDHNYETFM